MNVSNDSGRKSFFLSLLFTIILLVTAGSISIYVISDKTIEDMLLLSSAAMTIEENYPEDLNWDEMLLSLEKQCFQN